jgi:hypothetical protein
VPNEAQHGPDDGHSPPDRHLQEQGCWRDVRLGHDVTQLDANQHEQHRVELRGDGVKVVELEGSQRLNSTKARAPRQPPEARIAAEGISAHDVLTGRSSKSSPIPPRGTPNIRWTARGEFHVNLVASSETTRTSDPAAQPVPDRSHYRLRLSCGRRPGVARFGEAPGTPEEVLQAQGRRASPARQDERLPHGKTTWSKGNQYLCNDGTLEPIANA